MKKQLLLIYFLSFLVFPASVHSIEKKPLYLSKLIAEQSPVELRLYYMAESRLETDDLKRFFLRLDISEKKTYLRYLKQGISILFYTNID